MMEETAKARAVRAGKGSPEPLATFLDHSRAAAPDLGRGTFEGLLIDHPMAKTQTSALDTNVAQGDPLAGYASLPRKAVPRIPSFDSLRGVAACIVVLHHFSLCFFSPRRVWYVKPFLAGTSSVILFFVLSGYVLSLPYWAGRQLPYRPYLVRRFFRIYLPYAAALVLSILGAHHFLYSRLPLQPWFYTAWQTPLTSRLIAEHFFLMPVDGALNTAFWSLRYEVEMSIAIPFICLAILKTRGWWRLLIPPTAAIAGRALMQHHPIHAAVMTEIGTTLLWTSCFLYGILMAWQHNRLEGIYRRLPSWSRVALLILALLVFSSTRVLLVPLSACILLLSAQHTRVRDWLTLPLPSYLGRVSYSVYLIHGTILYATVISLYGRVSIPVLLAIYLAITFLVAHLFCIGVEEPCSRLGRRVTGGKPRTTPPSTKVPL